MVEVFKTNVRNPDQANLVLGQIHKTFVDYEANFDLDDCDKILRVQCTTGVIPSISLIHLLRDFGFHAEVLPDEYQAVGKHLPTPHKMLSAQLYDNIG